MPFMCPDCDDVELEFVTPETNASGHFECPECGATFTEDELTEDDDDDMDDELADFDDEEW